MTAVAAIELVLLLLIVATALAYLARRIGMAYPIVLVIGGLALGLAFTAIPDRPTVELPPDVVFLVFLPPILFGAGYSTPIRDLRANLRPIALLAVGLVLFTTLAVAVAVHAVQPELGWPASFVLGAIVAPPDAVAATAIFRRLGVPGRIVTILEGESLLNDASALIAYRVALNAVLFGTFSLVEAGLSFVVVGLGGVLVGVIAGLIITAAWRRTADPTLEIILSLLTPTATYLIAEQIGVSGVLATVAAGLIAGRRAARVLSPDGRLIGQGVWAVVLFLINGFAFILIGLQLPGILDALATRTPAELIGLGLVVSLTAIVTRIVWVYPATYLPRWASARIRARDPYPSPRAVFVVAWAGMRGVVSLAAALALPMGVPGRSLLIYLTFFTILATLVGQGLTLPWIVRRLGIVEGSGADAEEAVARRVATEAGLERLDGLADEYPGHRELVDQLRAGIEHDANHAASAEGAVGAELDAADRERLEHQEIRLALVAAQREAVIRLRDDGVIGDDALRRVERDLDLEAIHAAG